jgi:hypothetical protein
MPKCVELMAVYDDGTVERWEAPNGYLTFVGEPGSACSQPTTTTKPLRRVTVVRGRHDTHEADCIVDDGDGVYLSDLLPSGPARGEILLSGAYRGDDCDFRITVEATPVEVEP